MATTKTKSTPSAAALKKPRVAAVRIVGVSPYTQGKPFDPDSSRASDETADEFDKRCWKQRAHLFDGVAVIPAPAIHKALIAAAKFRGETIPGAGKKTWTKRFGAGVLILSHARIEPEVPEGELAFVDVHVPADGQPGGSRRVYRRFPIFREWSATVEITVVDGLIDEQTFERHMVTAGQFCGIGTHRPSSNSPGTNGRFRVERIDWSEIN